MMPSPPPSEKEEDDDADVASWHDQRDRNGATPLHYAAGNGSADVCRSLLLGCGGGSRLVDVPSHRDRRTPLHWAARNGHLEVVRVLVQEFGATVHSLARGNVTPLQLAVWQGHVEVARYLMTATMIERGGQKEAWHRSHDGSSEGDGEGAGHPNDHDNHHQQQHQRSSCPAPNNNNNNNTSNMFHYNDWGCHLGHWLGKSPIYAEALQGGNADASVTVVTPASSSSASSSFSSSASSSSPTTDGTRAAIVAARKRLEELCEWLDTGVTSTGDVGGGQASSSSSSDANSNNMSSSYQFWVRPNHQGQTPLHKAGFAGNLPVCEFLVNRCGVRDGRVDSQGNTAADCAERGGQPTTAAWLRRYASPVVDECVSTLLDLSTDGVGLWWGGQENGDGGGEADGTDGGCGPRRAAVPSLETIRAAYKALVRVYHPDRGGGAPSCQQSVSSNDRRRRLRWEAIQHAYCVLTTWWTDPDASDRQLRLLGRQSYLQQVGLIRWHEGWHDDQNNSHNNNHKNSHNNSNNKGGWTTTVTNPPPTVAVHDDGTNHQPRSPAGPPPPPSAVPTSPPPTAAPPPSDGGTTTTTTTTTTTPSAPLSEALEHNLRGFEMNLVRLLATMPQRRVRLAQLPKEYRKTWLTNSVGSVSVSGGSSSSNQEERGDDHDDDDGGPDRFRHLPLQYDVPVPRQYRCKKLSHVLKRYCSGSVEVVVVMMGPSDGDGSGPVPAVPLPGAPPAHPAASALAPTGGTYWVRLVSHNNETD
jgi:ankyrin repeat protein